MYIQSSRKDNYVSRLNRENFLMQWFHSFFEQETVYLVG